MIPLLAEITTGHIVTVTLLVLILLAVWFSFGYFPKVHAEIELLRQQADALEQKAENERLTSRAHAEALAAETRVSHAEANMHDFKLHRWQLESAREDATYAEDNPNVAQVDPSDSDEAHQIRTHGGAPDSPTQAG